ncbi:MAG: hypothetical protein JWQ02_320 [Capsulimonas sp.]|nr:hypothetical protein [Capsulimonas sp.]
MQLQHCFNFADALAGQRIVAVGIGPENDAIVLAASPDELDAVFGPQPQSPAIAPYAASILHWKDGVLSTVQVQALTGPSRKIQPLADGGFLLVSTRIYPIVGPLEHNGVIYDRHGQPTRRIFLGDAIKDVQVARDGRIWVSYFDEAVYGAWEWELGLHGLQCFDPQGEILWSFKPPTDFGYIDDCYALNVADDAVWTCYYTDFPVVQISNGYQTQGWRNKISGAGAIAIAENRVLLWGGYPPNRERGIVQTIEGGALTSPQELHITLPPSETAPITHVIGRGSTLHFIAGTSWYQFDLHTLPQLFERPPH